MAVETRVIIDANAKNAIREIGKLDDAAADADKALNKLDGADVDVDTKGAVSALDRVEDAAGDAKGALDKLDAERVTIDVDTSEVADAETETKELRRYAEDPIKIDIDVDADKLDTIKKKTDDVADSGRAGSTAIGGIGGSISELPGVGALGPIAESVGQLSENALEGDANMRQLAGAVGVLGGAAVVMAGINDIMQSMAQGQAVTKAFNTKQLEQFNKALEKGEDVAGDYADALEETGEVLATTGQKAGPAWAKILPGVGGLTAALSGMGKFGNVVEDILPLLNKAGVESDIWTQIVTSDKPAESMNTLRAALDATNLSEKEKSEILVGARAAQENYNDSVNNGAEVNKFFKTTTEDAAEEIENATTATGTYAEYLRDAALKTKGLEDANKRLRGELSNRAEYLGIQDAFDDVKAKGIEAYAAGVKGSKDAEEKQREYEQALIDTKVRVLDYMDAITGIPPEKQTEIIAMIDQGEYDKAEAALLALEKAREVPFSVILKGNRPKGFEDGISAGGTSTARSGGTTPVQNNVTVNVAARATPREIVAEVDRWARVNGARRL